VSPNVSFAEIAAACGYASALDTDSLGIISEWLDGAPLDGPRFARLLTRPGTPADLPRPTITPVDVKSRLMQHFGRQAVTERDRAASEGIPSGELARESPAGRAP
jgi:phosphonopyruvate decarboxylase